MKELKFDIEVFDPKKADLELIVNSTKDITADPKTITKEQLVIVSDTRKSLAKVRTKITTTFKAERENALKYQKDVIAYEKKLIAIIEPEEDRLKAIESAVKEHSIREVRREKLPEFKERLHTIDPGRVFKNEDELLDMDPNEQEAYYNEEVAAKNERDKVAQEEKEKADTEQKEKADLKFEKEQEAKQKELDEKQAKVDADAKKVADDAKQLERDKELEESKKEARKQAEKDAKAEVERKAKEKEEAAEEAKKVQEADEKYQAWLLEHGCSKQDMGGFIIAKSEETKEMVLYKEISRFKIKV